MMELIVVLVLVVIVLAVLLYDATRRVGRLRERVRECARSVDALRDSNYEVRTTLYNERARRAGERIEAAKVPGMMEVGLCTITGYDLKSGRLELMPHQVEPRLNGYDPKVNVNFAEWLKRPRRRVWVEE